MVVAVNTICSLSREGYRNFVFECFKRIAKQHPEHTFLLILSQPDESLNGVSPNIIPMVIRVRSMKLVLLKLWYNYKIASLLKKYEAAVCITSAAPYSFKIKIPQLLLIDDLSYLPDPSVFPETAFRYDKRSLSKLLHTAKIITVSSEFSKKDIRDNFKIKSSKIEVIYNGAGDLFTPVDLAKRRRIMEEYSAGHEYFLFPITMYSEKILLSLLKAFGLFKKWQKSSMKLLIVPGNTFETEEYFRHLRLFKYRDDVKLLENMSPDKLAAVTASAYVMIYTSLFQEFDVPPLNAMKCSIPVITGNTGAMIEICGDAVLYTDPVNQDDIAQQMMIIFKNENLKQELIKKGSERIKKYSLEKTSELLWQSILKAGS